jgi:DNA invertase Pin-like site-specific DNA recombinase
MTHDEKHLFVDEAISGSTINRPGFQALEKAIENKEVDAVAVDDLSRLSRSNHQMLTMVLKFHYHQTKIISVSDGIITDDDNAKLGIHIRGFINELYLDDLRKKTMRGLEGQKLRGFSAGENVYGYRTQPVGELKLNKKGKPKYDGMVHKINPEEAEIVKRIYKEFVDGKSIAKIAASLNKDRIPTKRGLIGGWNVSTLSHILKSEKYIGLWVWRNKKNVRDPISGKLKKVPRAKSEALTSQRDDLAIIDKETWDKAQKLWGRADRAWPIKKELKNTGSTQRSYVHTHPTHLFAGLLKCKLCGGAIVMMSGKGSGYYGCYNGGRKSCDNRLLVPRKRVEEIIISDLQNKLLTVENLKYIYKKVEDLISKSLNGVPEELKKKKLQYEKLSSEIRNYLNYIKAGNFSNAVADALKEVERKSEELKIEMGSLEFQKEGTFKAPPKEWIEHRLGHLRETLNKNTVQSALALKELLGEIVLEPVTEKELTTEAILKGDSPRLGETSVRGQSPFKPYYVAHTKIQTLALLDEEHKGSNWYCWRCVLSFVRTYFKGSP